MYTEGKPCAMKNASTAWGEVVTCLTGNIIDSIRLVPGSNPGQPIVLSCEVVTYLTSKVELWVGISIY